MIILMIVIRNYKILLLLYRFDEPKTIYILKRNYIFFFFSFLKWIEQASFTRSSMDAFDQRTRKVQIPSIGATHLSLTPIELYIQLYNI